MKFCFSFVVRHDNKRLIQPTMATLNAELLAKVATKHKNAIVSIPVSRLCDLVKNVQDTLATNHSEVVAALKNKTEPVSISKLVDLETAVFANVVSTVNERLVSFIHDEIARNIQTNNATIARCDAAIEEADDIVNQLLPYDFERLKLAQLRELAQSRGLDTTGTRAVLIARIYGNTK